MYSNNYISRYNRAILYPVMYNYTSYISRYDMAFFFFCKKTSPLARRPGSELLAADCVAPSLHPVSPLPPLSPLPSTTKVTISLLGSLSFLTLLDSLRPSVAILGTRFCCGHLWLCRLGSSVSHTDPLPIALVKCKKHPPGKVPPYDFFLWVSSVDLRATRLPRFGALAKVVNKGEAPPSLVALLLQFLEVWRGEWRCYPGRWKKKWHWCTRIVFLPKVDVFSCLGLN